MEAEPTAEMAQKHKGVIIGMKTAHFAGPGVDAGRARRRSRHDGRYSGDGRFRRPTVRSARSSELLRKKLRPGDIYTHCYSGLRGELDPMRGKSIRRMSTAASAA